MKFIETLIMSTFLFLGVVIASFFLLLIVTIPAQIYNGYHWNKEVENYFQLSEKASSIAKKTEYLNKYISILKERGLDSGESAMFFTTPTTDLKNQFELVTSLQERMNGLLVLSPNSLEYQQALRQITDNEYPYINTCIFANGYYLKQGWIKYIFTGSGGNCQHGDNIITSSDN